MFKNVKGDSSYTQKQVVIKNISNLNKNGFKNALNYCIKHSEKFTCYDSENNELTTPDVFKKWEKDFGTNTNSKDVWHLVFSIKEQDSFVSRSYLIQSAIETIKKISLLMILFLFHIGIKITLIFIFCLTKEIKSQIEKFTSKIGKKLEIFLIIYAMILPLL